MRRAHRLSLVLASLLVFAPACGASSSSSGSSTADPSHGRPSIARWEDETLGPLRLGMSATEIVSAIGEPVNRPAFETMEGSGDRVATWMWPDLGVELSMVEVQGTATVAAIILRAPCGFVAGHGGVAIGSAREDVIAAYADLPVHEGEDPREDASRPERFLIGDAYARLAYTFTDGRVSGIFLGSTGAE